MTEIPNVNLVGMDPGSNTFGLGVINIDPRTFEINYTEALSVEASRYMNNVWVPGTETHRRIEWIGQYASEFFERTRPVAMAIETNFMRMRTASALPPLIETVARVRRSLSDYKPTLTPYLITPVQGKSAVGASNKAKDKTLLPYIKALKILKYRGALSLDQLDEHALDAIVITYAMYKILRAQWLPDLADMEIIPCLKPRKLKR